MGDALYYEVHLTYATDNPRRAEDTCDKAGFWISVVDKEPDSGDGKELIATRRFATFAESMAQMAALQGELRRVGADVVRQKVEATVYDTKRVTLDALPR